MGAANEAGERGEVRFFGPAWFSVAFRPRRRSLHAFYHHHYYYYHCSIRENSYTLPLLFIYRAFVYFHRWTAKRRHVGEENLEKKRRIKQHSLWSDSTSNDSLTKGKKTRTFSFGSWLICFAIFVNFFQSISIFGGGDSFLTHKKTAPNFPGFPWNLLPWADRFSFSFLCFYQFYSKTCRSILGGKKEKKFFTLFTFLPSFCQIDIILRQKSGRKNYPSIFIVMLWMQFWTRKLNVSFFHAPFNLNDKQRDHRLSHLMKPFVDRLLSLYLLSCNNNSANFLLCGHFNARPLCVRLFFVSSHCRKKWRGLERPQKRASSI